MNAHDGVLQSRRRAAESSDQPADLIRALLQLHNRRMNVIVNGRLFAVSTDVVEVTEQAAGNRDQM